MLTNMRREIIKRSNSERTPVLNFNVVLSRRSDHWCPIKRKETKLIGAINLLNLYFH